MSETHSTDFARQLELAWAAGFFDGEGWTSVGRDKRQGYCLLAMGVGQVQREPLDRFHRTLGGKIYGPYRVENRFGRQPQYHWKATGLEARAILAVLWPYLTDVKRSQAQRAMNEDSGSGKPKPGKRTHCPQGHAYSGDNLAFKRNGWRRCRACEKDQRERKRAARLEAQKGDGD